MFGYALYALLLYMNFHYALASLLGTVCCILFNFKTTGTIVFENNNNRLLFKFIAVYCVTYDINVGCLKIFSLYGVNMYVAGLILVIPVALLSYTLLKNFVFGGDCDKTDKRSNTVFQRGR